MRVLSWTRFPAIVFLLVLSVALSLAGQHPSTTPALLEAIRNDNLELVRKLIKSGADPNTRDETGASALMYAAVYASSQDMLRALLDSGADVNAAHNNGATALMWAAADTTKVRLLLDRGASVTPKTKNGTTALLAAARQGNLQAMRLLVARGADPTTTGTDRVGLLQIAFERQDPGMQRLIAGWRLTPATDMWG